MGLLERFSRARFPTLLVLITLAQCVSVPAQAQKRYDPGANDTEIRIGQSMPYSGPVSMQGTVGKAGKAYFDKINAEGGII
jgi:branched-chain amino acid transport system substrate-binding protein